MARTPLSGIQHSLRAGDYEAVVASVGASLRVLRFDGRDLILPFEADQVRPGHRGATLAPWPNRVVDGRYRFDGVDRQVPLTEPARGHALHGLASWLDYIAIDKGPSHVTLEGVIEAQKGYPWRIVVRTTFSLGADGLTQTVTAHNDGTSAAPWGTASHPYLVAGSGAVDQWRLHLPARKVLRVSEERMLPDGLVAVDAEDPERFDFREPRVVGSARLDHAFTDLIADDSASVQAEVVDEHGVGTRVIWGEACRWVQAFTTDLPGDRFDRAALAIEPMTCAPDAFNQDAYAYDTGLITLQPGESSTASWRIAAVD